ncbi:MAG: GNAT family N-acetyltransferase [Leptolyngbya sp. Prado105]|jgi:predicted acetyltransferase|nr:GNAT family N-acetyltransferase [Leptolyngbya sp. Prado105]
MQFTSHPPEDFEDLKQFGRILSQCFDAPISDEPVYLSRIGAENTRVLRSSSEIIGGLGLLNLGQWYNGANIPMVGVAAVGIAPEWRGKGTAYALLHSTLQELHDREIPISVLFSAAQPLYRKVGYEQAGAFCIWEVDTASIQVRSQELSARSLDLDSNFFPTLYNQQAPFNQGFLDRNAVIWANLYSFDSKSPTYAYQIGEEGYITFHQSQGRLIVKDWVLLTPEAVQQFWTFLANHRSQIDRIEWRSSPVDLLSLSLPDQTAKIKSLSRWMLRIVHLKQALEQRRYPDSISTELHLNIHDPLLSKNHGLFILSVDKGKGQLTSGGDGNLALTINALAPLYTGLFTAEELIRSYQLTGTAAAIRTATQLFTSALPWMPDAF